MNNSGGGHKRHLLIVTMVFRNCSEGLKNELHSRVDFVL